MEYLMPVSESKNGHNAILVIVDSLTKMVHFIPITDKVTAKETAELFLQNVFHYHELSDNIISD